MKKVVWLSAILLLLVFTGYANPVSEETAQKVAVNFFKEIIPVNINSVSLVYTETDSVNSPLYFVFDINSADGFVIVSADDKFYPIVGYSTEKRPYTLPQAGTNIYYWMLKRKTEMTKDIDNAKVVATTAIANQWAAFINNTGTSGGSHRALSGLFPSYTSYLVQSTWNQATPYYNDCPGDGSNKAVTGCVATAMCQIMRYWQYPLKGIGSSSYLSYNYGYLSADYDHIYPWSAMALTSPGLSDTNMPRAMSDAGISVDMGYSPEGSGAEVITADDPYACAQIAYTEYFNYSPKIMDGLYAFADQVAWQDTIEHELDRSRPVQYVGWDPNEGGHTWVCDGYDNNNNFHMNWGWGGYDDGWYALGNLNPAGMNFSQNIEALIGIVPPTPTAAPTANFAASSKATCTGDKVLFMDASSNQPNNWQWTFTGGTPSSSSIQNPMVTYSSTGVYPVKLVVKNSLGSDSLVSTNFITIDSAPPIPVIQHAGSLISCVPNTYSHYQWYRNNNIMVGDTVSQFWASQVGVYRVVVSNEVGCSAVSADCAVEVLGINELSQQSGNVLLYPNPSNGRFAVSITNYELGSTNHIEIYNALGKKVYSEQLSIVNHPLSINLSDQPAGIYLYRVVTDKGVLVVEGKFVISK